MSGFFHAKNLSQYRGKQLRRLYYYKTHEVWLLSVMSFITIVRKKIIYVKKISEKNYCNFEKAYDIV